MFPRVGSALLALGATVLLALSVSSAWWDGNPTLNGRVMDRKTFTVTLFSAQGCNVGGDEVCKPIKLTGGFAAQQYIEVGVIGVLALAAIALGLLAALGSSRRRTLAKLAMAAAGAGAIVAVALVIQGPQVPPDPSIKSLTTPLGLGMPLFGIGALCAIGGGVFALLPQTRRPKPAWTPPVIQQLPAHPHPHPQPPPQPQVDVLALLQDDTLRPASLGPEPMMAWRNGAPPGGTLPGPSAQHAVPTPPPQQPAAPLFHGAPQLRPLYDAAPNQGGTGGYVPHAPVPLPMRPPTPVPRDAISAMAGIPTPPAIEAQRPPPGGAPRTLPPPNRSKPQSVAPPPIPPRTTGITKPPPLRPPQPTSLGLGAVPAPSVPFPAPPSRVRLETDPVDADETVEREKPVVDATADTADVFDPNATSLPTGTFDGAATVARDPSAPSLPSGENTDVGIVPISDGTSASQQFELPTSESPAFGAPARADTDVGEGGAVADGGDVGDGGGDTDPPAEPPPPMTATSSSEPAPLPPPTAVSTPDSGPLTIPARSEVPAGPRASAVMAAANVSLPPPPAAARSTGAQPAAKVSAQLPAAAPPRTGAIPAAPKPPTGQIRIPISTAPESLPPPTQKQATTSGPSPACPQCEAPMAWVEEHLRFYCKSCKMYF